MTSELKCSLHNDEIVLLDISKQPFRKNLLYCWDCISQVKLDKICQIKKVQEQANSYCGEMKKKISEEYDQWISKINETKKKIITLKQQILTSFDEMIKKCEENLNQLTKNMKQEQEFYQNVTKEMTLKNLEQIGNMLSGNHQRESKINQNKECSENLGGEIAMHLNQVIQNQFDVINEIRQVSMHQIKQQNLIKQDSLCWALARNTENNMIVGGRGNDIVIWQQSQFELKETHVLKGHIDTVTAIVIYQSGDLIVSGGAQNDKSMKLWRKINNQWTCGQTINNHQGRINDLQLTQNQNQLISACDDELIKIWIMRKPDYKLECIQTLDEHNNLVYWISISKDQMIMASSSSENYFNLYKNEQTQMNPWKKLKQIETKGKINRVYFTNTDDLLVQQVNPPQLIVYTKNQNNQFSAIQQVSLNQPDDLNILFPVFQINNKIYLKNQQFVYIINRLRTGKYFIQQILTEYYVCGCRDSSGEGILFWNYCNLSIEFYK